MNQLHLTRLAVVTAVTAAAVAAVEHVARRRASASVDMRDQAVQALLSVVETMHAGEETSERITLLNATTPFTLNLRIEQGNS